MDGRHRIFLDHQVIAEYDGNCVVFVDHGENLTTPNRLTVQRDGVVIRVFEADEWHAHETPEDVGCGGAPGTAVGCERCHPTSIALTPERLSRLMLDPPIC